jgi:ABC-type sugar transport system permease subunit
MLGAFTAPAAAVAWLARSRWHGRILAGAIVVVNVFMDAAMIAESLDAERGMVDRVWEAMPGVVILAAVLVVVWQILPVAALIFSRRAAPAPGPHS